MMNMASVQVFDAELGLVRRQKTLSNSASEFIENHPIDVFGQEAPQLTGSTFVPELDSFVENENIQQPNYYAQSEARLIEFKKTLADFSAMIKERKLDKKLDIEIKKPDKYTMDDVVNIAAKMELRHQNAASMKSCMGVIRKVFRKAGDNKSTLKKLLTFVPNDAYGSVITGGFTLILGAIDRADNLRHEIATAIAAIPERLERTKILLGVYKSSKLHFCADGVFLAVFSLLICIVKELDKSLSRKGFSATLKGDRYGHELSEAIEALDLSLEKFKDEADLCAAERLGRIERHAVGGRADMADMRKALEDMEKRQDERAQHAKQAVVQEFENQRALLLKRMEDLELERISQASPSGANVTTNYYVLFTSSPYFDPKTGTLDEYQAEAYKRLTAPTGATLEALRAPSPALSMRSTGSSAGSSDLVRDLYKGFDKRAPWRDVEECLGHFDQFSGAEKDRAKHILFSEEVDDWLQKQHSQILLVEPVNAPEDVLNPLTFAASFLAKSFRSNKSKPTVLCFHCGIRANEACEEEASGPLAMLNSLNAQLLTQMYKAKGSVHIPILDDPRRRSKLRKRIPKALKLFRQILDAFSSQDPIFIVLDSLSRMPGSQEHREEALEGLLRAAEDADCMIKFALTDVCSLSHIVEERDCILLYVDDYVDGWRQDSSVDHLDEDSRILKRDLRRRRRRKVDSDSDDTDSDDTDDSD